MTEQPPGEQIAEKQTAEGAETMLDSDSESNDEQMEQLGNRKQQQQLSDKESEWQSRQSRK